MYDEELQAYAFVDTNSKVPAEGCIYVIFHGPVKRYFRYDPMIGQFNQNNARNHDWTTRYSLFKDYIFHQNTDQTNYVKQPKVELKRNYDQMTGQRQDFHNQEAVKCKHSDGLYMKHLQNEDPYLQEQTKQTQEKPKLENASYHLQLPRYPIYIDTQNASTP